MSFFSNATFRFLKELKENNDRDWFEENRSRYEADLKEPAQKLILAVGERLGGVSPELRADPRGNGGSLFRIYRDVRFSKDKSPYKTSVGIQFRHSRGKDAHAPGLYLHIEPGESFFGFGAWRPAPPALAAIRTHMVYDPAGWKKATGSAAFKKAFELHGESLKRIPRGFDPEHPLADDLRRKDFIGGAPMTQAEIKSDDLPDQFIKLSMKARPLMQYLCDALDVPF